MKQIYSSKRILAFILTFIMIVSNIKLIPVFATGEEPITNDMTVTEQVTVGDSSVELGVKVTYTIGEKESNPYQDMITSFGTPVVNQDFNNYTASDKVSDAVAVYNNNTNCLSFAKDAQENTYVWFNNPNAGARIELNPKGNKVVVECKVGYNNTGATFRIFAKGSTNSAAWIFGEMKDGKFNYGGSEPMAFEAGEMYKVTYMIDTTTGTHDVYIDEVLMKEGINSSQFDGFSAVGSAMRLWVSGADAEKNNEDVMIDDIKVYVKQ